MKAHDALPCRQAGESTQLGSAQRSAASWTSEGPLDGVASRAPRLSLIEPFASLPPAELAEPRAQGPRPSAPIPSIQSMSSPACGCAT